MAVDRKTDISRSPVRPLGTREGVKAFARLLDRYPVKGSIIVGNIDYGLLKRHPISVSARLLAQNKHPYPSVRIPASAPAAHLHLRGRKNEADYTEIERKIAKIWQEVLGYDEIDVNDNFFEIGGDSLNIIQIQLKLEKYHRYKINIAQLFAHPTISKLAGLAEDMETMVNQDNILYSDDIYAKVADKILDDKDDGNKLFKNIKDYDELNKKIDEFAKLFE